MVLLSFSLSIAIYTIWLNATLGILISLVMCGMLAIGVGGWLFFRQKRRDPSYFFKHWAISCLWIVVGNVLALVMVCGNLRWKGGNYLQQFQGTCCEEAPVTFSVFNGFGRITDTQKYHVYLFEDTTGKVWRLNSNQTYHIGDQLFLSANVKPLDQSIIFDSTFILPRKAGFWAYQFNYDKRAFMKGIDGTAYEKSAILVPAGGGSFTMAMSIPPDKKLGLIDRMRARLQGYVETVYGQNQYAGLLLGLLIGDKSLIPTKEYTTFVSSGLVHIIAVSGGNIAMVVILLSFLLKRVPLYVRNGVILVMIVLYAMICGGDSSVVRAAIMGCLTLIALFWGREVSVRRAMKYAFVGILVFSPFSLVYDVGLLLSFSAIIGIVLFQQRMEERGRLFGGLPEGAGGGQKSGTKKVSFFQSKLWKEYLTPTIRASLGTAPVLMFFMEGVNVVGIVLNVVIVPLIPVITIYGFASLVLYALVSRTGWGMVEVSLMKVVYGLSAFGEQYAIFVQAKNLAAKYILVGLFVGLGVWRYVRGEHKKLSLGR